MRCPARWKRKHSSAYGQPGGSTVDDADFTNSPIASSLFKTVLLSTAKFLGKFIYACFRHSISPILAARIRARPLLIHGELVPSHRATMFVIPRLFPGHDGTYPHALDYRVQHTQARGLNAHGLTVAESVGYSAVSPLVEACASAIFLACASADSMPIFHPVSLAAKRAFWPSLPMASDS